MQNEYRRRVLIEGSNVPGNPLRSNRMSMLAHGFLDTDSRRHFSLDDSDAVNYSVMRIRRPTRSGYENLGIVLLLARRRDPRRHIGPSS